MFCLKCGKEIPDESTFCSACGYNISGKVSRMHNTVADNGKEIMSAEELDKKMRAILVFCITALIELSVIFALIITKMQCFTLIIGNSPYAERYLEDAWTEHGFLITLIGFALLLGELFAGFMMYLIPYKKRDFASVKKSVISSCVVDGLVVLAGGGWLAYLINSEGYDNFMVILIAVVVATSRIFVAISYSFAANAEEGEKYMNSHSSATSRMSRLSSGNAVDTATGLWRCGKCGTDNKNTDSFCRDCGNYK